MHIYNADLDHALQHARDDLLTLKGARIFITGGTGFIGRWLVESLCHANSVLHLDARITVLSRQPDAFFLAFPHLAYDPAVSLHQGDVRTFEFPNGEFSHVIHGATDVAETIPYLDVFDVCVNGTRRVLEFCRQRKIREVLLLSSGAVYGPIPHHFDTVPEEYRGMPLVDAINSAYGLGKIGTEWLGKAYSADGEMSCKYARIFAQIGPYLPLDRQFAAGNFVLSALRNEVIIIKGDGTPRRSYMYAADLVIWLWRILIKGDSCRAYNVGSNHSISIRQLATVIAVAAGRSDADIEIQGKINNAATYERYVPDTSRAQYELGLKTYIDLEEAVRRTIDWHRPLIAIKDK